ncbi:MAG TPA: class I SAM-dependent methyltransferase [Candidatus Acidoferrales bacterium]|nr:class I SAM-dependent methyltransferase [Candidatus Acidoferrales bacterium]
MLQTRVEEFRERVRREWDDQQTVAAWRKWSHTNFETLAGVTRALVEAAGVRPGQSILDLASGSGQPALALAAAVAPGGMVTASDMSAGMLAVAEENAVRAGLENVRFRQANAESLPFPDRTFDRVTCRFGVMFFADIAGAMRECRRVLLPGGRAAFAVWGAADQPFFGMTVGVLRRYIVLPKPEPGAPHVFRFAEPGTLAAAMREAGFGEVREERRQIPCERVGTPETFWQEFREVAAPFRRLIEELAPDRRAELDVEVLETMRRYMNGDRMRFDVDVNIAMGANS